MFKLYDKVTSKKTGLPAVGTIKVVCDGHYFYNWRGQSVDARWSSLYNNWSEKLCYFVEFDIPQKPCSLDEVTEELNKMGVYDTDEIKERYDSIPNVKSAIYPEDDLELL